jgi:hypothetical protein
MADVTAVVPHSSRATTCSSRCTSPPPPPPTLGVLALASVGGSTHGGRGGGGGGPAAARPPAAAAAAAAAARPRRRRRPAPAAMLLLVRRARGCSGTARQSQQPDRGRSTGRQAIRQAAAPNGCLIEAPCPPCTSHGASIRQPFEHHAHLASPGGKAQSRGSAAFSLSQQ